MTFLCLNWLEADSFDAVLRYCTIDSRVSWLEKWTWPNFSQFDPCRTWCCGKSVLCFQLALYYFYRINEDLSTSTPGEACCVGITQAHCNVYDGSHNYMGTCRVSSACVAMWNNYAMEFRQWTLYWHSKEV
jgi:hypothetical protein